MPLNTARRLRGPRPIHPLHGGQAGVTARANSPAELREQENRFVRRCQNGDAAAWEELVQCHTRRVYGMCHRFIGRECDARDMTQEVFLRVFRTLESFRVDELSFVAWLTLVTRNLLLDNYRRTRRARQTISIDGHERWIENLPHHGRCPDEVFARREANAIMQAALSKLAPDLQEIITLYDLHELRYCEIAGRLGIPIGTVKSRLNRGRGMLAHVLRRYKLAA